MTKICTILARAGSVGVPSKNMRPLCGIPLIAYSIMQAKETGIFDSIVVSSDSDKILKIAEHYGATHLVKRPEELASSTAPKLPAIKHCVLEFEKIAGKKCEIIVDLDPTSPLRNIEDIFGCVHKLVNEKADNVITATPSRKSPYFNMIEISDAGTAKLSKEIITSVARRQDSPRVYDMNASVYVWWRNTLLENDSLWLPKTMAFIMPEERSVDIDSLIDFEFVEMLANKTGSLQKYSNERYHEV